MTAANGNGTTTARGRFRHFRVTFAERVAPWLAGAFGGTALITLYYVTPLTAFRPDRHVLNTLSFAAALILLATFTVAQVVAVSEGVPRAVSFGLPVALCLVIVLFSAIYAVMAQVHGEFDGLNDKTDALYFTVTTLSTVGYGDIHPASREARIVVMLQILFDLVLVAGAAGSLRDATARRRQARLDARGAVPSLSASVIGADGRADPDPDSGS